MLLHFLALLPFLSGLRSCFVLWNGSVDSFWSSSTSFTKGTKDATFLCSTVWLIQMKAKVEKSKTDAAFTNFSPRSMCMFHDFFFFFRWIIEGDWKECFLSSLSYLFSFRHDTYYLAAHHFVKCSGVGSGAETADNDTTASNARFSVSNPDIWPWWGTPASEEILLPWPTHRPRPTSHPSAITSPFNSSLEKQLYTENY